MRGSLSALLVAGHETHGEKVPPSLRDVRDDIGWKLRDVRLASIQ